MLVILYYVMLIYQKEKKHISNNMVIGLCPLRAIGGFTLLLTLGSHGISQSAHKLTRTPIVIKYTYIGCVCGAI